MAIKNDVDESSVLLTIFLTVMIQAIAIIENNRHFQSMRNEMQSQTNALVADDLQHSLQQTANRAELADQFRMMLDAIDQGFKERKEQMDKIISRLPSPTPAVPLLPLQNQVIRPP